MNPLQIGQALLASSADAIVATDRDGIIRHWNPGAERIFGHSAAEAVGQSLDLIIPEKLRARHWEGYAQVMQTGRSRYGEGDLLAVPGLRKDGTRVSLEFTIAPIRDAGTDDRDRGDPARRDAAFRGDEGAAEARGQRLARGLFLASCLLHRRRLFCIVWISDCKSIEYHNPKQFFAN